MRSLKIVLVVAVSVVCFSHCQAAEGDWPVGSVLSWRNPALQFFYGGGSFPLPATWFENRCDNIDRADQHFDVLGEGGIVYTSTPGKGANAESTVDSRKRSGTFDHLTVLMNPDLEWEDTKASMDTMDGWVYDEGMYMASALDALLTCGMQSWFRNVGMWIKALKEFLGIYSCHCVSYALRAVGEPDPDITMPYDFVQEARAGDRGSWIVIADYDIVGGKLVEEGD